MAIEGSMLPDGGAELSRRPELRMRRASSLVLLASASLLMAAACDNLRLPAPPARSAGATALDSQPAPARKANRAPKRNAKVDPALDGQRFDQIRRGLRRLVAAEETYYAENGIYTEDLSRIGFAPDGDTEVRFLWLSRDGWAASGTHPGVPGRDCVIYVGRAHGAPTTIRDVRSGREGVPVCDAAPASRRGPAASARAPAAAAGPPTPAAPALPDTGSALDAVNPSVQMRVDLRNLVRSQDTYFGLQGVYSKRTEPFALQYLWHRGVTITILSANNASWSARATHASRPAKSCVIWMGPVSQRPSTEAQKRVADQPATPVCDD
jgi:hypothetical protein